MAEEKTPLKWKFEAGGEVRSIPEVSDGVVYFGSFDHHLYALDVKTGKEKWKFQTGGNFKSSPAVSDGVVYFGSSDNHLYAVDIKIAEKLAHNVGMSFINLT
jgi:outer membrane protein assembly factor BamB